MASPNPLSAIVAGFAEGFSNTHNRRIQQQLAIKAQQNAQMAEVATKSLLENPDLAGNDEFMKFYGSVAGKDNAKGMAEVAATFAQSPVGVLHKAFGAANITRPDVPPEGPVFNPAAPDAQPAAINAVVGPRLAQQTPVETGVGFDSQTGFLQAKTQQEALRDPKTGLLPADAAKLAQKERESLRKQGNADREFGLKSRGEQRRQLDQTTKLLQGKVEVRQTPVGERSVIRRVDPETGQIFVTAVGGVKQAAPVGEIQRVMRQVNQGLVIADTLDTMARKSPQEVAALFKPFVGKKLADLENQLGSFSGFQKKFLLKLFELRNLRVREQGGASLTENEARLYNDVLPSNLNTLVTMAGAAIEHSIETLTEIGAVTEGNTEQARSAPIRTRIVNPRQRDYYKLMRRASKHSFRDRAQIPLLPGEILDDGSAAPTIKNNSGPLTLQGGSAVDADLDAAFMQATP